MHLKGRKTNTIDIGVLWSSKHCYNNKSNYCLCNSYHVFLSPESEGYLLLHISLEDQPYSKHYHGPDERDMSPPSPRVGGVVKVPGQGSDLQ